MSGPPYAPGKVGSSWLARPELRVDALLNEQTEGAQYILALLQIDL